MADLREALKYAGQNPESDFAKFLTQRITSGETDVEAQELGLDLSPIKEKYQKPPERIEKFRREAITAEEEAREMETVLGKAEIFGKEFISRLGEVTGITPTAERIAAGIAPYVVPEEELPGVVEELVGLEKEPIAKELAEVAIDLPLIGLGLSKNIARAITKQAGKMTTSQFVKFANRPLMDFLPKRVQEIARKEVTEIPEEVVGAVKTRRLEKAKSEVGEAVGKIVQGKPKDIPVATRALKNIDTEGIKTYSDLSERITEKVDTVATHLDSFLDKQTGIFKNPDLIQTTKIDKRIVKQNFVDDAIKQLKELYTKIKEPTELAKISNLEDKLTREGLTVRELNDLSRQYGREFSKKAFSKTTGEPLTSINAQAFENTRKGIKEAVRGKIEGNVPKELDKQMSDLLSTRVLTNKMEIKVNSLYQRIQKRGIFEQLSRKLADIVDVALLKTPTGFFSRMFPSNIGLKTMNAIDIENQLAKNLKKIDKLMKLENDDAVITGIETIIRENQ